MANRASYGNCELCGKRAAKSSMSRHLKSCVEKHQTSGKVGPVFHLRVEGKTPLYWLDIEASATARLSDLDQFLRDIWLECCGHLSAFSIGEVDYSLDAADDFEGFFPRRRKQRSMETSLERALTSANSRPFRYEYDFGSTTELKIRCLGKRIGKHASPSLRLLARNEPPQWPCSVCGGAASLICPECMYGGDPFLCEKHAEGHGCVGADEMLPVVNSPRMGICGYCG